MPTPSALILCANYAGSLAAVRSLGRAGVEVTVASTTPFSVCGVSRYAANRRRIGDVDTAGKLLSQLSRIGDRARRYVLFSSSDEMSWLISKHLRLLSKNFLTYCPAFETMEQIIDKKRLWLACKAASVATVDSWFPESRGAVIAMSRELAFPVLIKPRSHIFDPLSQRGKVVANQASLVKSVTEYLSSGRATHPTTHPYPLLQSFAKDAVENVVSISGFIDRTGTRTVLRASRKVLQRSRPVGVGLAFETVEVDQTLGDAALRLCRQIKYFGIFEIEFVYLDEAWRLIDFNPRFYREMQLEISNGAPLPLLAYLDAIGDFVALDHAIAAAKRKPMLNSIGFSDVFTTRLTLAARFIRSLGADKKGLVWHWQMRGRLVDAFFDWRDPLPGLYHIIFVVQAMLRHILGSVILSVTEPPWLTRCVHEPD